MSTGVWVGRVGLVLRQVLLVVLAPVLVQVLVQVLVLEVQEVQDERGVQDLAPGPLHTPSIRPGAYSINKRLVGAA